MPPGTLVGVPVGVTVDVGVGVTPTSRLVPTEVLDRAGVLPVVFVSVGATGIRPIFAPFPPLGSISVNQRALSGPATILLGRLLVVGIE